MRFSIPQYHSSIVRCTKSSRFSHHPTRIVTSFSVCLMISFQSISFFITKPSKRSFVRRMFDPPQRMSFLEEVFQQSIWLKIYFFLNIHEIYYRRFCLVFQTKITTVATMKKEEKVVIALNAMDELFKDYPLTELEYETPFQLLLSVLLSAQTTDVQVNKVTKSFYQKVRCPDDILPLGEPWVKEYIKTVGLHVSKTKNVVITSLKNDDIIFQIR